jgi:hypothetical protein
MPFIGKVRQDGIRDWIVRFSLSTMGDDRLTGAAFIGLMTSIYLMIRAFDNIKNGLDQRRESKEKEPRREDLRGP